MPDSWVKIGRICPKRPEFSVDVVDATVIKSCARAGTATMDPRLDTAQSKNVRVVESMVIFSLMIG
jgi:hypothetical protein